MTVEEKKKKEGKWLNNVFPPVVRNTLLINALKSVIFKSNMSPLFYP